MALLKQKIKRMDKEKNAAILYTTAQQEIQHEKRETMCVYVNINMNSTLKAGYHVAKIFNFIQNASANNNGKLGKVNLNRNSTSNKAPKKLHRRK